MTCQDVDAVVNCVVAKGKFVAQGSEKDDENFDQRLSFEIIPDAHDAEEQALDWFSYLEEHLQFPFQAECVLPNARPLHSVLVSEVNVVGLPSEDVCKARDVCQHQVAGTDRWLCRLLNLTGVEVDEETEQAIQDWHTWVDRGYEL